MKTKASMKLEMEKRKAAEHQAHLEKVGREVAVKAVAAAREEIRALRSPLLVPAIKQTADETPMTTAGKRMRFK